MAVMPPMSTEPLLTVVLAPWLKVVRQPWMETRYPPKWKNSFGIEDCYSHLLQPFYEIVAFVLPETFSSAFRILRMPKSTRLTR